MGWKYILTDSEGFPYKFEFKPDFEKYGDKYHGYQTNNQEAIFYYFAVLGYDLQFEFNGTTHYFLSTENYVARTDDKFSQELEVFAMQTKWSRRLKLTASHLYPSLTI